MRNKIGGQNKKEPRKLKISGVCKKCYSRGSYSEAAGCTDFCFVLNPQYFVSILGGSCLTDPRGVWILPGIRARAAPLPPGRSRCRY